MIIEKYFFTIFISERKKEKKEEGGRRNNTQWVIKGNSTNWNWNLNRFEVSVFNKMANCTNKYNFYILNWYEFNYNNDIIIFINQIRHISKYLIFYGPNI